MFKDAIVTTDVGQNQLWTTQFLEIDENKRMLTSGGLGTMGYGLPAASGAKLGNPHKDVIVISGDGSMQMNIQEMAMAVRSLYIVCSAACHLSSLERIDWLQAFAVLVSLNVCRHILSTLSSVPRR